jgi:hypothetical protein
MRSNARATTQEEWQKRNHVGGTMHKLQSDRSNVGRVVARKEQQHVRSNNARKVVTHGK